MILFTDKYDCCGCTACKNICPKKAIDMKIDDKGFFYPIIDSKTCIECGLCKKVCPFNNEIIENDRLDNIEVYAAKNKIESVRKKSSSGGIFTVISDFVLRNNGSVYGAKFNAKFEVNHGRAINANERDNFKGSKYVQSNLNNIFLNIKEDIMEEKYVMFTGTPCQVAGLKMYLGEKIDKSKLFLCDIICHGTPSQKLFNDYMKFMEKIYGSNIKKVNFRSKSLENEVTDMKIIFENGDIYNKPSGKDIFYRLFYTDMVLRPSCYNCKFSNLKRVSDITIGDYWGIESIMPEFEDKKGVSLVLINTSKGKKLFTNIQNDLEARKSCIVDCLQPNLKNSTTLNPKSKYFWDDYNKKGFEYIARKYADYGVIGEIRREIKWKVTRLNKKLNKIFSKK